MKTEEIRTKNSEGFLILPKIFESKGFKYEQIERRGDFAIYSQTSTKFEDDSPAFLPMVIQKHPEYILGESVIEAREGVPSDQEWGRLAYTCLTLEKAQKRLAELEEYVKELEQEKLKNKK